MSPRAVGEDPAVMKDEAERDEGVRHSQVLQEPEHLALPLFPWPRRADQGHVEKEDGAGNAGDRRGNTHLWLVDEYINSLLANDRKFQTIMDCLKTWLNKVTRK